MASPLVGLLGVIAGLFFGVQEVRAAAWAHESPAVGRFVVPIIATVLGATLLFLAFYERRREAPTEDGDREATESAAARAKTSRLDRLLEARDFLPEQPPDGWSPPLAMGHPRRWVVDTKDEVIALTLERGPWIMAVTVFIAGRGTDQPVSDARCAQILAHVRHVGEFIEGDGEEKHPGVRRWIAVPVGQRPRWRVPEKLPPLRERKLSPHLVAARKYLPLKLPPGWSVPVAIGDDHGTEWKDGAWMIGTAEGRLILVCLVTSKGRVKLSVSFFQPDGEEVSEGSAVEMLRHFRGVLEFAQTEPPAEGEVPTRTYLGEIAPEGAPRAMLN